MPQITRYKTPCPESVNSQILQMVVDNLTDISMVAIAPSNLLYNVYLMRTTVSISGAPPERLVMGCWTSVKRFSASAERISLYQAIRN